MGDTISRADAIEQIQTWAVNLANPKMLSREDAIYILESMSSAQPEIIRCKECKHWFDIDDGRQMHRMCADICGDWFCADAERRTDDE